MAESPFSTSNKALDFCDWIVGVSFFTGICHLGYGCKKFSEANAKMKNVAKDALKTPEPTTNLNNRKTCQLSAKGLKEEGWRHIRRGLIALLLPIIGSIVLLILDALRPKKEIPPLIIAPLSNTPSPEIEEELSPHVKEFYEIYNEPDKVKKLFSQLTTKKDFAKCIEIGCVLTGQEIKSFASQSNNCFNLSEDDLGPDVENDLLYHLIKNIKPTNRERLLASLMRRKDLGPLFYQRLMKIGHTLFAEDSGKSVFSHLAVKYEKEDTLLAHLKTERASDLTFSEFFLTCKPDKINDQASHLLNNNPTFCEDVFKQGPHSKEVQNSFLPLALKYKQLFTLLAQNPDTADIHQPLKDLTTTQLKWLASSSYDPFCFSQITIRKLCNELPAAKFSSLIECAAKSKIPTVSIEQLLIWFYHAAKTSLHYDNYTVSQLHGLIFDLCLQNKLFFNETASPLFYAAAAFAFQHYNSLEHVGLIASLKRLAKKNIHLIETSANPEAQKWIAANVNVYVIWTTPEALALAEKNHFGWNESEPARVQIAFLTQLFQNLHSEQIGKFIESHVHCLEQKGKFLKHVIAAGSQLENPDKKDMVYFMAKTLLFNFHKDLIPLFSPPSKHLEEFCKLYKKEFNDYGTMLLP